MSRLRYFLCIGLTFAIGSYGHAENRAVEISISGIGPPVDHAALETVQQVIGHAVGDGMIDQFTVSGYGIEGGFSACAQAAPRAEKTDLKTFVRQLRSIVPDPATTAYRVMRVPSCAADDNTACTQDAKICPDGSAVGRVPPSCRFAPCP